MDIVDVKTKCKNGQWEARIEKGNILLADLETGEAVLLSGVSKTKEKTARWKYWAGWGGNHDKRIEDAVCSHCGYKHPTVYGSPDLLANTCPQCRRRMQKA